MSSTSFRKSNALKKVEKSLESFRDTILGLSEKELVALGEDVARLDDTNCWFVTYQARHLISQAVDDSLHDRQAHSET